MQTVIVWKERTDSQIYETLLLLLIVDSVPVLLPPPFATPASTAPCSATPLNSSPTSEPNYLSSSWGEVGPSPSNQLSKDRPTITVLLTKAGTPTPCSNSIGPRSAAGPPPWLSSLPSSCCSSSAGGRIARPVQRPTKPRCTRWRQSLDRDQAIGVPTIPGLPSIPGEGATQVTHLPDTPGSPGSTRPSHMEGTRPTPPSRPSPPNRLDKPWLPLEDWPHLPAPLQTGAASTRLVRLAPGSLTWTNIPRNPSSVGPIPAGTSPGSPAATHSTPSMRVQAKPRPQHRLLQELEELLLPPCPRPSERSWIALRPRTTPQANFNN